MIRKAFPAFRPIHLPVPGSRVGSVDDWGILDLDHAGIVLCHAIDQWGVYALILRDNGRTARCRGLNECTDIGWHLIVRA